MNKAPVPEIDYETLYICPTCVRKLPKDCFTKCAKSPSGLYYECKFCKQARAHK